MSVGQSARVVLFGLTVLLAPAVANAEQVPQEYLTADYENCMAQSEGTAYTLVQRERYCQCTVGEFAKLDFDSYLQMTGEVLENAPSAETTQYLESVEATCAPNLTQ